MAGQRAAATPLPSFSHRRHILPIGRSIGRQINTPATAQAMALSVPSDDHGTPLANFAKAWTASRIAWLVRHFSYAQSVILRQLQHSALVCAILYLKDRAEVYLARVPRPHVTVKERLDTLDAACRTVPD